MRHPFDGINPLATERPTRRSMLAKLFAAAAGLGGLLLGSRSRASAQTATTLALGEEGGRVLLTKAAGEDGTPITTQGGREAGIRPPTVTTFALGEEGGPVTTQAVGEEGGPVTTQAVGEEGMATTLAVGEEGATTRAVGEEGATTQALGEEGGGRQ